jgi:hypothetical protein
VSRKRESAGANWSQDRLLRDEGAKLVDATDEAIEARAEELGADPRRLRAFVLDARRRAGK